MDKACRKLTGIFANQPMLNCLMGVARNGLVQEIWDDLRCLVAANLAVLFINIAFVLKHGDVNLYTKAARMRPAASCIYKP